MMSLLPFWAWEYLIPTFLSTEGQEDLGFYQKYFNSCSEDEVLWFWTDMKVSN